MMIATWRPTSCPSRVLGITKFPLKFFSGWFELRTRRCGGALCGARRIAHHLFEHFQIFEIARASVRREPHHGLRAVVVVALLDRDQTRLLQHLQVTR